MPLRRVVDMGLVSGRAGGREGKEGRSYHAMCDVNAKEEKASSFFPISPEDDDDDDDDDDDGGSSSSSLKNDGAWAIIWRFA